MAALLGNHVLTEKDLREFHCKLVPEMETAKVTPEVVIRAVVNYIRTLVNVDDTQALGAEIFGSVTDPRVGKLKEVVEYYTAGTEDGYKNFKPNKMKKKEGIKISTLASDNDQSHEESQEIYNSLTASKKSVSLVCKETEETAEKLANLVLTEDKPVIKEEDEEAEIKDKDVAEDNSDAVAAVVNNSVKPSENGKYPTKDKRKIPDKACIPAVNSEVVKTAADRHRQASMSPYLYNLLTTGEMMIPVVMEEEGGELPNIHYIYRDLRRRVYGILFNLHHANFTRQKFEDDVQAAKKKVEEIAKKLAKVKPDSIIMKNNEPRSEREVLNEKMEAATAVLGQLTKAQPADSAENIIIREWTCYNKYQEPDPVTPLSLSWPVPTVQRLWFGTSIEDKQKRLRAFLTVMSSDTPMMLSTNHVPQHLLLMASVLRYIMAQNNILRKPELDAFLVTAVSPELMDTEYLAKMKLDLVTSRGVQLAALFMEGVEMALFANDACGAPVPFLMSCPWLFFDGKLFHSKLRRAVVSKNLLEMCEHRMDIVMKVERMRTAILEGLVPDYNKPTAPIPHLMNNMGMNNFRPMGMGMGGMGPMWQGSNNRGFGGGPFGGMGPNMGMGMGMGRDHMIARGGQLVVAGSVVGQWGPNFGGRGGHGGAQTWSSRGTRGGKKKNKDKKEKKEKVVEDDNEDVKIMTVKEVLSKEKKDLTVNEE